MAKTCNHYLLFHPLHPYAVEEELIIWKKKITNVIMFGKIPTILYLGEKERYLAHSLPQEDFYYLK